MSEQLTDRPRDKEPAAPSLERSVDGLHRTFGRVRDIPVSMKQADMQKQLDEMRKDGQYGDMAELLSFNKVLYRKSSLQRQKESDAYKADQKNNKKVDTEEFIVANEAQTFFEYMESVLQRVLTTSDQCIALRRTLPHISEEATVAERELQVFTDELERTLARRLQFSNASLADHLLSVQKNSSGQVVQDQRTLLKQLDIIKEKMRANGDSAGLAALEKRDRKAMRIHSNSLDQALIKLLAAKGDLPGRYLLTLQVERYAGILRQQISLVRDSGRDAAKREFQKLKLKNELAGEGKGKPLQGKEAGRYKELAELLGRRNPAFDSLHDDRRGVSDAMIRTAEDLSEFHEEALELTLIQHQFGSADSTLDASGSNPDDAPEEVREKIAESMQQRSSFHRERLGAFVSRFDEEVLTIGIPERIEEFSNVQGREFVRQVTNKLSALFTLPVPEKLGLRSFVRGKLAGPLNDSMGWPAEKMDMPFEKLDSDEQQAVMEKARSVAQAVREFDRTKIKTVQNPFEVIALLP